jgi:hypothetical protein
MVNAKSLADTLGYRFGLLLRGASALVLILQNDRSEKDAIRQRDCDYR